MGSDQRGLVEPSILVVDHHQLVVRINPDVRVWITGIPHLGRSTFSGGDSSGTSKEVGPAVANSSIAAPHSGQAVIVDGPALTAAQRVFNLIARGAADLAAQPPQP
jgi:hypothetical protein